MRYMLDIKNSINEVNFEEFKDMLYQNDLSYDEIASKIFPEGTETQREWIIYYIKKHFVRTAFTNIKSYIKEQIELRDVEWY